jgi:hypothetical protein
MGNLFQLIFQAPRRTSLAFLFEERVQHPTFGDSQRRRLFNLLDERIRKLIDDAKCRILATLTEFTAEIRKIVDAEVADDMSRRTVSRLFEASLDRAESKTEQSVKKVTDLLGQTSQSMQQRVDEAVDESLSGVCRGCSEDSGIGWRSRSVARIVEGTSEVAAQAEERCIDIAEEVFERLEKSVESFCKNAMTEMAKMGENIPSVLKDAVERSRLTTPQAQRAVLETARASTPEALRGR